MFIERLTNEHLCEFFGTSKVYLSLNNYVYGNEEKYLYVSYEYEGHYDTESKNERMYDFEGSTCSSETKWRKFLYKIFGEEYLIEYKKWLEKQMEFKIKAILE